MRSRRLIVVGGAALTLVVAGAAASLSGAASQASDSAVAVAQTQIVQAAAPKLPVFKPVVVPKPSKRYKIAALLPHVAESTLQSFQSALRAEAKKYGASISFYVAGGYDKLDRQVAQFEAAIASKVDAVIVWPITNDGLNAQIADAKKAGIPVFAGLAEVNSPQVTTGVIDDLTEFGRIVARGVAAKLNGKGDVFLVLGGAGGSYNVNYRKGIKQVFSRYPGLKIVLDQDAGPIFDPALVQSKTENALTRYPDVDAIITTLLYEQRGAVQALRSQGMDPRKLVLGSTTLSSFTDIKDIKSGLNDVVVQQATTTGARWLVDYAIKHLEGQKVPKRIVIADALLTQQNVAKLKLGDYLDSKTLGK